MSLGRILLVDDEPDMRLSTAQALDLAGFDVEEAPDAQAALDRVSFGFAGILVTDIRMPGMDGLSLMCRIREIDADIPVILVTGHGDIQLAVRAMREGAYDFVEKPFDAGQLAEIAARGRPGPTSSMLKVRGTELAQSLTELAVRAIGYYAAPDDFEARQPGSNVAPVSGPDEMVLMPRYLDYRAATIYGGSNEIQRNIMAKLVLGM